MSESYWTERVALVYRELEEELIEIIIKRLKKGTNNKKDITQWQFEKLQDLGLINAQTIKRIAEASKRSEKEVSEAFRVGPNEVIQQVDKASQQPRKAPNTNIDQIIKGYANQAKTQLNLTGEGLGLWTYGSQDMIQKYRRVIERTASFVNTGIHTLEQAVQRASHEILTEGLKTTMRDKNGRKISVDSYVRTVMKTNLARTYDEVRKEHMEDHGMHHVVVGSLVGAREACSKIQGQVVDLRPMEEIPEGSEYRSIYDPYWEAYYKEASGHHGINCRHPHFPFVPGVNTNNQPQYDEELNEQVAKDQQKQRSLERQIRNYKKHLKIAQEFGNQEDIDRYTKLISGRQKALREHLDGHEYLSRDYARERAFDFSVSPPKDIVVPEVVKEVKLPKSMEHLDEVLKERRKEIVDQAKFVSEEMAQDFEQSIKAMIDNNHLGVRVPDLDILEEILDTKFKNQFETGTSKGALDKKLRTEMPTKVFGIPQEEVKNMLDEEFEKYGYLVKKDLEKEFSPFNAASNYGDVVVTFKKDQVAPRTTFTLGDSLDNLETAKASPVNDPSIATMEDRHLKGGVTGPVIDLLKAHKEDPSQFSRNVGLEYIELQFHGQLTSEDIESVTFKTQTMNTVHGGDRVGAMIDRLKNLGIEVIAIEE